ncbi:MAG TPA: rhomboid family intramembrane serine protease [Candidatus Acidoferrales bacterium]|nr:rhomboid family intramembrane serine protease [Candidatus Acidoferrales bacterium]
MPLPLRWRWKLERWRDSFSGMFHAKESERRPQLCPACGTLVGSTATRCHQCGASLTFSLAAASRKLSRIMPSTAPVTYGILVSCCVLYGLSLLLTLRIGGQVAPQGGGILGMLFGIGSVDSRVLQAMGASLPLPINLAQPWRLITASFLHANLMHIVFNMWVLVDLAPAVEEVYGSSRFLFLYIACGIGGYVLSGFMGHFSIGASGAIVGLIGVLLAITYRRGGSHMQQLRSQVYRWIIYLVLWGFFFPGIDNMAHLGGGITGFILGKLMMDREPADASERKRAYLLGWGTAVVVLASFVLTIVAARTGFHIHY